MAQVGVKDVDRLLRRFVKKHERNFSPWIPVNPYQVVDVPNQTAPIRATEWLDGQTASKRYLVDQLNQRGLVPLNVLGVGREKLVIEIKGGSVVTIGKRGGPQVGGQPDATLPKSDYLEVSESQQNGDLFSR